MEIDPGGRNCIEVGLAGAVLNRVLTEDGTGRAGQGECSHASQWGGPLLKYGRHDPVRSITHLE